jgi:hypothetical protein
MSRRDDRSRPSHTGVIIGMCIAGAFLFLFLAGMAFILIRGVEKEADKGDSVAPKQPALKVWSKQDFEQAVLNKSTAEVIATVGRPDDTETNNGPSVGLLVTATWYYRNRVMNDVTGRPYAYVMVQVQQHKQVDQVIRIVYP